MLLAFLKIYIHTGIQAVPCISAGMTPVLLLNEINTPLFSACGVAEKLYSAVGSMPFTKIIAKRELIASSDPFTNEEKLYNGLLVSLFRLTLHPVIADVLHASSQVNSNVLLFTLLHATLYMAVIAS